jgi:ABC-type multidrug transport system fused ATPase/permease subunit
MGPKIQRAHRGRQERIAQINGHIQEMIFAHPMIQIFNLQNHIRRKMFPEIHEFRRVEIRSDFLRAIFEEVSDLGDLFSTKLVLIAGGILALAAFDPAVSAVIGSISVGTIIGFNALMGRFVQPVHRLANIYASVAYAAAALRRIEEVLSQETEPMGTPPNGTAEPPAIREGIVIENVCFSYGTDPTLRDVYVSIPAGTTAAFVGPTGAGKTTLVNMIPRFYDPNEGRVLIDGRDVREYALPALRSQIALVSQENFLFNTTIRENIALGKLGATDAEIEEAAKAAKIHDFVMSLPAGYDTIIGERGSRLSGGQRQRVAIARALLRDAPILILDEATSALDAETEAEILDELAEATRGKTTISITHRLALAMRADKIHVLDQGRIVESGTHDELFARRGLYRKLFEDQNEYLVNAGLIGASAAIGAAAANGAAQSESAVIAEPQA